MTEVHPPIRVLVIDDSAFARKVVREVLEAAAGIEVVGIARDGLDALEKIAELRPDVVTLDLVMPELDGVGVLRALKGREGAPRVIVVTMTDLAGDLGVEALEEGAFDAVHKPTAIATDRLYELGAELVAKVRSAVMAPDGVTRAPERPSSPGMQAVKPRPRSSTTEVLVIGASTGGPQAVGRLVRALPADFPVPVAVVLHMPEGYTAAFASRLDGDCAFEVVEAHHDLALAPGRVVVGRAGQHLVLAAGADGRARAQLAFEPLELPHRPAVDVLFSSAARVFGARTLGVVLTGMGNDGLAGSRAIRAAGGRVFTEARRSCVVYGMPRAVFDEGLSDGEAVVDEMAALVVAAVSGA